MRLFVLSSLQSQCVALGGLLLLGGTSAWAQSPSPPAAGIGAGPGVVPDATPPDGAASKRRDLPLSLLMRRKLSVNDEPHLPESVKARYVCNVLRGRYRFCVLPRGEVDTVETQTSIPGADPEITRVLKSWKFQPSPDPSAACAVQTFDFDIPGPGTLCDRPKPVHRNWLQERQLSGDPLRLPSAALPASAVGKTALYKFCVNKEGVVTTAFPLRGLGGVDSTVVDTLKRWRYSSLPFVACTFELLRVTLDEAGKPSLTTSATLGGSDPVLPPAVPVARPRVVPAVLIRKEKLSGEDPHLPDKVKADRVGTVVTGSYKLCIAKDGLIGDVAVISGIPDADDKIVTTLSTWRYKPQIIPICFVQFLEFHIDAPEVPPPG